MIFSEHNTAKAPSFDEIASLQHWWSLAGVDVDYVEEPHSMLEEVVEKTPITSNPQAAQPSIVQEKPADFAINTNFPDEIDEFLKWMGQSKNLIESNWARKFVLPEGKIEPDYMIVSAMPEGHNHGNFSHFTPKSQELVGNIVKALGSEIEECFHTPLALGRPVDGQIANPNMKPLIDRFLHLITLVKPKQIILFGDTVSRALLAEDLLTARKKKQYINHLSSKTEAIVTFHPRILLARPELKTEAWKDLQQLTRIGAQ